MAFLFSERKYTEKNLNAYLSLKHRFSATKNACAFAVFFVTMCNIFSFFMEEVMKVPITFIFIFLPLWFSSCAHSTIYLGDEILSGSARKVKGGAQACKYYPFFLNFSEYDDRFEEALDNFSNEFSTPVLLNPEKLKIEEIQYWWVIGYSSCLRLIIKESRQ